VSSTRWPQINTDRPAGTRATRGWPTSRCRQEEPPPSAQTGVLPGGIGSLAWPGGPRPSGAVHGSGSGAVCVCPCCLWL